MNHALDQVNEILGEGNREQISTLLKDLATISGSLASQDQAIREIPVQLNRALEQLQMGLQEVRAIAAELKPGLGSTVSNLDQASQDFALIAARMESWAAGNDSEMNAFMSDGLGQVPVLMTDARRVLRELEKLVKELKEDPSRIIYKPNEAAIDTENQP